MRSCDRLARRSMRSTSGFGIVRGSAIPRAWAPPGGVEFLGRLAAENRMVKLGPWVPGMDHRNCPGAASPQRAAWRHFDPRLTARVEELRAGDPDVARSWDDATVRDYASVANAVVTAGASPRWTIPTI
jgi:hypothetical protein